MTAIFVPNKKIEDLSEDFIKKVSSLDLETLNNIEKEKVFRRFQTSYLLMKGSPKTFSYKVLI